MTDDKRLIEDYLPIEEISVEASSEPKTKGHISTLHIWRARRPLVASRAAVYGALVPDSQFSPNRKDAKGANKGRESAKVFVQGLCQYPGSLIAIREAAQHILKAHADRLSRDLGREVTVADIENGVAPRPRVLDMFAGGGAIPLEASRLGCETYAIELNPVAYLIELCTISFPQQFGSTLADDVEKWGKLVLEGTRKQVSDLFSQFPRKYAAPTKSETLPHFEHASHDRQRGDDERLGIFSEGGQPAPLIDVLHRLLWLMERQPQEIPEFLKKARVNTEQLRVLAQALIGPTLKGSELEAAATGTELAALTRLTANWRSVIDDGGPLFKAALQRE